LWSVTRGTVTVSRATRTPQARVRGRVSLRWPTLFVNAAGATFHPARGAPAELTRAACLRRPRRCAAAARHAAPLAAAGGCNVRDASRFRATRHKKTAAHLTLRVTRLLAARGVRRVQRRPRVSENFSLVAHTARWDNPTSPQTQADSPLSVKQPTHNR
jgi:hypothetical protein